MGKAVGRILWLASGQSTPRSAALRGWEVEAAGQSPMGPMTPACDLAAIIAHLCAVTLCLTETLLRVLGNPVGHAGAAYGGSPLLLG